MSEMIFKIKGMDCAEETNALRKAVGGLPGISDVKFNILNGTMSVTAAKRADDNGAIITAVERIGMRARLVDKTTHDVSPTGVEKFWQTYGRAVLCAISGLAVATGFLSTGFCTAAFWMPLLEARKANSMFFLRCPADSILSG